MDDCYLNLSIAKSVLGSSVRMFVVLSNNLPEFQKDSLSQLILQISQLLNNVQQNISQDKILEIHCYLILVFSYGLMENHELEISQGLAQFIQQYYIHLRALKNDLVDLDIIIGIK